MSERCEVLLEQVGGRWRLSSVQAPVLFGDQAAALKWAERMANGRELVVREPK